MRLIDADELIYMTIGEDTDKPFKFVPTEFIENAEEVEAIPVEWLHCNCPYWLKNKCKCIKEIKGDEETTGETE